MWAPTRIRAPAHAATPRLARPTDTEIAAVLRALAEALGADKTFCPSEAARRLSDDWRALMPDVRRVAAEMHLRGTQKGVEIDIITAQGPIRLSRPR